MGMVKRELYFRDRGELMDYLKMQYDFEISEGDSELKGIELNTILVDAEIEDMKNEVVLRLKKLVSLKAFLLSRETGMDINKLVFNIDDLMKMSEDGLNWNGNWIADDESLAEFFRAAGISKGDVDGALKDGKRSVNVKKLRGNYDFNSIVEI